MQLAWRWLEVCCGVFLLFQTRRRNTRACGLRTQQWPDNCWMTMEKCCLLRRMAEMPGVCVLVRMCCRELTAACSNHQNTILLFLTRYRVPVSSRYVCDAISMMLQDVRSAFTVNIHTYMNVMLQKRELVCFNWNSVHGPWYSRMFTRICAGLFVQRKWKNHKIVWHKDFDLNYYLELRFLLLLLSSCKIISCNILHYNHSPTSKPGIELNT